ncbi:MAG TPA: CARDB domain-containing protein, partial [Actinomycetota bacterium]|nr:CARDB domain-containing protein [Actinomycetota bacterium]
MRPDRPSRFAFVSTLATLAALVTAAPASAVPLPDLVVSAVSTNAARVVRGHAFGVASTVKNLGQAAAAASTERFYLSADKLRGVGDRRMIQVRQIARLSHNATSAGTISLKPTVATPEGIYYVVACADDLAKVKESNERNNCRTTATRVNVVAGPTSADLIDKDLTAGTITSDQAM